MKIDGIQSFIKIGLAFYKKQVKVKYEMEV